MPNYVYKCSRCGATKEVVVPIAERDSRPIFCEACGDISNVTDTLSRMHRESSAPAFTVRGGTPKFHK